MKFTETEIRTLQVGDTIGPFLATRKDIHRAQANICNYKAKWPGAEFKNKSVPAIGLQPDGKKVILKGWYEFTVTRISVGISADTGEQERLITKQ